MEVVTDIELLKEENGDLVLRVKKSDIRTEHGDDVFDLGYVWETTVIQKQEQE